MELFEEIAERVKQLNASIRVEQLQKQNEILAATVEVQKNHISDLETVNKFRLVQLQNKDLEIDSLNERITILESTVKKFYETSEAKDEEIDKLQSNVFISGIYEALGWQGGTIYQVIAEIKRLKKFEAEND